MRGKLQTAQECVLMLVSKFFIALVPFTFCSLIKDEVDDWLKVTPLTSGKTVMKAHKKVEASPPPPLNHEVQNVSFMDLNIFPSVGGEKLHVEPATNSYLKALPQPKPLSPQAAKEKGIEVAVQQTKEEVAPPSLPPISPPFQCLSVPSFQRFDCSGRFVRQLGEDGLLGTGAFGAVRACMDMETGEVVAVKEILLPEEKKEKMKPYVVRELKILKKLSEDGHPAFLKVFEVHLDEQVGCIAMELVQGITAKSITIEQNGEPYVRDVVQEMLAGLARLHELKMCHNDLKASNMMVQHGGRVKLIDFGMAEDFSKGTSRTDTSGSNSHKPLEFLWGAAKPDPAMVRLAWQSPTLYDEYAAGITLWELLFGTPRVTPQKEFLDRAADLQFKDTTEHCMKTQERKGLLFSREACEVFGLLVDGYQPAEVLLHPWFTLDDEGFYRAQVSVLESRVEAVHKEFYDVFTKAEDMVKRSRRLQARADAMRAYASQELKAELRDLDEMRVKVELDNNGIGLPSELQGMKFSLGSSDSKTRVV